MPHMGGNLAVSSDGTLLIGLILKSPSSTRLGKTQTASGIHFVRGWCAYGVADTPLVWNPWIRIVINQLPQSLPYRLSIQSSDLRHESDPAVS